MLVITNSQWCSINYQIDLQQNLELLQYHVINNAVSNGSGTIINSETLTALDLMCSWISSVDIINSINMGNGTQNNVLNVIEFFNKSVFFLNQLMAELMHCHFRAERYQ